MQAAWVPAGCCCEDVRMPRSWTRPWPPFKSSHGDVSTIRPRGHRWGPLQRNATSVEAGRSIPQLLSALSVKAAAETCTPRRCDVKPVPAVHQPRAARFDHALRSLLYHLQWLVKDFSGLSGSKDSPPFTLGGHTWCAPASLTRAFCPLSPDTLLQTNKARLLAMLYLQSDRQFIL